MDPGNIYVPGLGTIRLPGVSPAAHNSSGKSLLPFMRYLPPGGGVRIILR